MLPTPGLPLALGRTSRGFPEPDKARELARQAMAFYLPLVNYRNNWRRLGFSEEDLAGGGTSLFLDAMVAWGTETAIRRRTQAHLDAGANHVCIQPLHPEGQLLPDYDALTAPAGQLRRAWDGQWRPSAASTEASTHGSSFGTGISNDLSRPIGRSAVLPEGRLRGKPRHSSRWHLMAGKRRNRPLVE
jgi:hypothetical protein